MIGKDWRGGLDLIATVLLAGACVMLIRSEACPRQVQISTEQPPVTQPPETPLPTDPVSMVGLFAKGSETAKVGVVAFSEFHCPYCARFAQETMPALQERFVDTGVVRFAFWHFPIAELHPGAFRAAEFAQCAGAEAKFWPMHDLLFKAPRALTEADIQSIVGDLKLNATAFDRCLSGEAKAGIQDNITKARSLGIRVTPTFFVGPIDPDGRVHVQKVLLGAKSAEAFAAAIRSSMPKDR